MSGPDLETLKSFTSSLGYFHARFSTFDCCTDFAIYKSLGVTAYQAHLITAGMMFGRKAKLLADLLKDKDTAESKKLLSSFNKVRGNNKRDIIAHGYHFLGANKVVFVERAISGPFRSKSHEFTMGEFCDYCISFGNSAQEFIERFDPQEIDSFSMQALSFSNNE